ncbi:alpha/beta hydrolase [Nocardioides sp. GCM10027113]|uniref:alpha/beta hydrolase n=1 Tax=unclassified Nocardioides TaxID=2615069 RepID=UPI0036154213
MSRPDLARLGHAAESLTFRTALALPERVQRLLAGPPVVVDGQTLAVDTQLMQRLQQLVREPGPETLAIEDARRAMLRQARLAGGNQPIGAVRDLPLGDLPGRLYVPTEKVAVSGNGAGHPLLLFFHGGGWAYGDLDSHDAACRFVAERSGVQVLAVDYRLGPEHPFPAAYEDALAAHRWVVENAESLGVDPQRIAVGGDSAGGNLAAGVALAAAEAGLPLAFQLLVYPGTDLRGGTRSRELFAEGFYLTSRFIEVTLEAYAPDPATHEDPRLSVLLADVPAGLAPAYVVTAGYDPLRDEGEAYARKLADAGVEVELKRFPDQIHGFFNMVGAGRTSRAAVAQIAAKLRAALTSAPVAG